MLILLQYSNYSWKTLQSFFLQATYTKTNYTSYNYEEADCDKLEQAVCILPHEAKYTLLELFSHQPNMTGWIGCMKNLDSMTVSVDCDVCKQLSLIGK